MSEETENGRLVATDAVAVEPPRETIQVAPARAGGSLAWLIALVALGVSGFALWRVHTIGQGEIGAQQALRSELGERIDTVTRNADLRKRELDTLRARVADADGVNRSLREELLGFGERSRHLEDAVANLAEQRLSGRDAMARNEAEFLLQLAQERLALFHDVPATLAAYDLADSALAAAEDPVFASVRDTIQAERTALDASKPLQTQVAIASLERIRASLATLQPPTPAAEAASAQPSRWESFLAQFVRVSHSGEGPPGARDLPLNRALAAIDVRAAEAALLARDASGFTSALARVRSAVVANFDGGAAPTRTTLAEIDHLAATPLAPAIPELGNALKELRNLRVTRALAQPPASLAPSETTPAPVPQPDEAGP